MVCGNFILPEPASYVFFYAFSNLRNLLYIIGGCGGFTDAALLICECYRFQQDTSSNKKGALRLLF